MDTDSEDGFGLEHFSIPSKLDTAVSGSQRETGINRDMQAAVNRQWESLVVSSSSAGLSNSHLAYPWEKGIAAKIWPPAKSPFSIPRPPADLFTDTSQAPTAGSIRVRPERDIGGANWASIAHRISDVAWDKHETESREVALRKWKMILSAAGQNCALGRRLVSDILLFKDDKVLVTIISDVFSNKATRTLHRRADSLVKFLNYCRNTSYAPFPVRAVQVYLFLKGGRMGSPSAAQSFREALHFSHGTLGIDGAQEAADDIMVKGLAFAAACNKRTLKQAPTLTVDQIDALLVVCCDSQDPLDVLFSGHCLFCLTLRSRWTDSQYIDDVDEDIFDDPDGEGISGYVQGNTCRHKTATSAAKRTTFLPMTGPVRILGNSSWYLAWLKARQALGLTPVSKPMMPTVLKGGKLGSSALSASEATAWLRELLGPFPDGTPQPSTHSLKSTYLSWCAKWGMEHEHRCTLGYHMQPGRTSLYVYSRDNLAHPLRLMEQMLAAVVAGTFRPDATRSGRFISKPDPRPGAESGEENSEWIATDEEASNGAEAGRSPERRDVVESVPVEAEELSDSSASDYSDESESEFASINEWDGLYDRNATRVSVDDCSFVYHTVWHTLHKRSEEFEGKTMCGRCITFKFEPVHTEPAFNVPFCKVCFKTSNA